MLPRIPGLLFDFTSSPLGLSCRKSKSLLFILNGMLLSSALLSFGCAAADGVVIYPTYVIQGFTLSLAAVRNDVEGDFNNSDALYAFNEVIAVPDIKQGYGYKIGFGYRANHDAFEFSYVRSKHDATVFSTTEQATYELFNLDYKHYFTLNPLQPLILIGFVPSAELTVNNGSVSAGGRVGGARFKGSGFNLGGGFAYNIPYPDWTLSFEFDAYYRWVSFDRATGVLGIQGDIDNPPDGSAMNYLASVVAIF